MKKEKEINHRLQDSTDGVTRLEEIADETVLKGLHRTALQADTLASFKAVL